MVTVSNWQGLVTNRSDNFDALRIAAPSATAVGSWSGPFRVIASDGHEYFVKSLDTCPQGQEASLAIEFVVARVGGLIGAPMLNTSLIRIPDELAGWEPRSGVRLQPGFAHASRALEHADEQGRPALLARHQNDNRRRHVGIYALYDWCFGSDPQWLYDLDADRTIYSHDHGLYLPPESEGRWTSEALLAQVHTPRVLPDDPTGISRSKIAEVAEVLEALRRSALVAILGQVPQSWPVTDHDLEMLGWYLEERAPGVAARIRSLC